MAVFRLRSLEYASETSFALNAENPSANTWDQKIPAENIVLTLGHERMPDLASQDRANNRGLSHLGVRTGTLEFDTNICGHFTDPSSGSLTERWPVTLLGYALGGKRTAGAGSTIIGSATSTTSVLYLASAAGWVAGDMLAHGSKGDARGDGQVLVASGITGGSGKIDLLTEAVGSSGSTTDTISRMALIYHDETAALTTTRWSGMSSDTGAQFHMMGCQLADLRWTIPLDGSSGLPKWHWTYNVAYWARQATTFPSALTLQDDFAAPCAGGSFFLANVGTKTRTTKTPATIQLELEMGLVPTVGPGGAGTYQVITAWSRPTVSPALTIQIPWETARETAFDIANQSYTYEHGLLTANPTGGRRWAFYMPRMFYEGNRPNQVENVNDLNYLTARWRGTEGTDTATALTRSAIRFGFG